MTTCDCDIITTKHRNSIGTLTILTFFSHSKRHSQEKTHLNFFTHFGRTKETNVDDDNGVDDNKKKTFNESI